MEDKKRKVLIVVDMQHDFVDGILGTPEAKAIVPKVDELISNGGFDDIFYTFDTHYTQSYYNGLEGKSIPIHCVYGTHGWSLATMHVEADEKHAVVKKSFGALNWFDIFNHAFSKGFYRYAEPSSDPFESITIVGLCTDICVVSNALILRAFFPDVPIICDASCCAGTTPENHKAALKVMKSCLIDIVNEEVIK